jgi:hypothetical protein
MQSRVRYNERHTATICDHLTSSRSSLLCTVSLLQNDLFNPDDATSHGGQNEDKKGQKEETRLLFVRRIHIDPTLRVGERRSLGVDYSSSVTAFAVVEDGRPSSGISPAKPTAETLRCSQ